MRWERSGDFRRAVLPNGTRLFVREAPRFKSTWISAFLRSPLGSDPAPTALIPFVLKQGTRSLPTERAIRRRLEELCGTTLDVEVHRFGRHQVAAWEMEVPCERFLPSSLRRDFLGEAFFLLREILADPLTDGAAFRADVVAREKENLAMLLAAQIEQKERYAYEKCRRMLAGADPAGRHPYGSAAGIRRIRPAGLFRRWRRWLAESSFDLYAMGPVPPDAVLARAAAALAFPRREAADGRSATRFRTGGAVRRAAERLDARQARLCLGFASGIDPAGAGRAADALGFAAALLGGFSHSRLFRTVREEKSLAYSVGCFADRATGWVFVDAGVEPANTRRALDLIREEIDNVRRGRFTADEFAKTRACLRQGLRRLADLRAAQIDAHYEEGLLGRTFTRHAALADLAVLRPADVARAARGLALKAVFTAGPGRGAA